MREAGERTKIAVWSRDRDVDCVGPVLDEGDASAVDHPRVARRKIDIIEYSDEPVTFATHALSQPDHAGMYRRSVDRHMEVIVDDSQLSLAIGKKGQNTCGWGRSSWDGIDIKSAEEKRQEVETQMAALVVPGAPVSVLVEHGLVDELLELLLAAGITTVEKLGSMTPEELEQLPGIGPEMVEKDTVQRDRLLQPIRDRNGSLGADGQVEPPIVVEPGLVVEAGSVADPREILEAPAAKRRFIGRRICYDGEFGLKGIADSCYNGSAFYL